VASTDNLRAVSRSRRTVLSVPGSNPRMMDKAQRLDADEIFLDLEDAVAADAKDEARRNVVAALQSGGWGTRTVAVRVNDWTTSWTHRDVVDVVTQAGARIDCVVLSKADSAHQVAALDLLLTQAEKTAGLEVGRIGIEVQIESARALLDIDAIASASARTEALVFGPADFMASLNMRTLVVGEQPPGYEIGDAYHYALMRILVTARAHDLQAIDGPYLQVRDTAGFRRSAQSAAALGYDGKWVLHPDQIETGNHVFSPAQEDYERAEAILTAYEHSTSTAGGRRGAVMLGDEMIDEASRKMALVVAAKGRAAGLQRTSQFDPPQD
jgi:citrate lyase subunit beta/citryl-CoA lyase